MPDAAVIVPVYRTEEGHLRAVLVRRNEGGFHGGDLAFPGGKREPRDGSLLETALRETREEIGLPASAIRVLEQLPPERTRTTGFHIAPFLARVDPPPTWRRDEREIAEVIEVRLDDLPEAHAAEVPTTPDGGPAYRVGPHWLWGVSYRILHPVLPRLLAGEWGV